MKLSLPAAVSLCLLALPAFAQDDTEETEQQNVNMNVGLPGIPGANMNMNMNVKVKTTRTEKTRVETAREIPSEPRDHRRRRGGPDCGTGEDPGCSMMRSGQHPMDAETFAGMIESLRNTSNEITRAEMAQDMMKSNWMTALQYGMVLDLFENEIYRFDIAKAGAPRVVNPKHALRFSTKFDNSIYAGDYTKLIAAQR